MKANRRSTPLRVVALSIIGALALSGCEAYDLPLPGSPVDADEAIEITAEFNDVLNLVPRSVVKTNDVTVGEVTDVERSGWAAKVTMRIRDDVILPENTVAAVQQTSLLGEKYVSLDAGPGPAVGRLTDGANLGLSQTERNPELEEVLASVGALLNGGGLTQLKTITTELNNIFNGRQDRVRSVVRRIDVLVGGLDAQKGDIIRAMESLNSLSTTLNREKQTIQTAITELAPAAEVLADQQDELVALLRAVNRLGKVGTRVVVRTKEDLLSVLADLRPVLREIADVDDQLSTALSLFISFPFPIESNNIVYGDYANTEIVFSVDLSNQLPGGVTLPREAPSTQPRRGNQTPRLPQLPGVDLPELGLPSLPGLPGLPSSGARPQAGAQDVPDLLGGLLR